nr:MAG TPA: histone [Caudoviricetes sp.]DAZ05732.1 MAG TPA: hypothetical protein [Caudoviricetes sp.]
MIGNTSKVTRKEIEGAYHPLHTHRWTSHRHCEKKHTL